MSALSYSRESCAECTGGQQAIRWSVLTGSHALVACTLFIVDFFFVRRDIVVVDGCAEWEVERIVGGWRGINPKAARNNCLRRWISVGGAEKWGYGVERSGPRLEHWPALGRGKCEGQAESWSLQLYRGAGDVSLAGHGYMNRARAWSALSACRLQVAAVRRFGASGTNQPLDIDIATVSCHCGYERYPQTTTAQTEPTWVSSL